MASKRYTTEQVIGHLRQAEILASEGKTVLEVVRELGISEQTYYRWCKEYGGMEVSQARRLKELEQEIGRLKRASNRFREVQITIRSTAVLVLRLCMPPYRFRCFSGNASPSGRGICCQYPLTSFPLAIIACWCSGSLPLTSGGIYRSVNPHLLLFERFGSDPCSSKSV